MKCVRVAGDSGTVGEFLRRFTNENASAGICIAEEDPNGGWRLRCPGSSSPLELLGAMPPDLSLIVTPRKLAMPVIWCGGGETENSALVIARYPAEEVSMDLVLKKSFQLLPHKTEEECGRCGMDCMGMAAAILRGDRIPSDCYFAPGSVDVLLKGRRVELGKFPADIIAKGIRGMVSSLRGYRDGDGIRVEIR